MDATEEYEPIHPPDAITDNLGMGPNTIATSRRLIADPSKHLGTLVPNSLPKPATESPAPAPASVQIPQKTTQPSGDPQPEEYVKPDLEQVLSLHDFEAIARRTMTRRGWNYYSS